MRKSVDLEEPFQRSHPKRVGLKYNEKPMPNQRQNGRMNHKSYL